MGDRLHQMFRFFLLVISATVFLGVVVTTKLDSAKQIAFSLPPDEVANWQGAENVLGETSARTCPGISFLDVKLDKETSVPDDYVPLDLVYLSSRGVPATGRLQLRAEAANQLKLILDEMRKQGMSFVVYSAFRSSATQAQVYREWLAQLGSGAKMVSAPPGHSEHQLGTTVDITLPDGKSVYPSKTWDWLDQNAHKFGFVMSYRFPQEHQTGYEFEPWHWRFVGVDLATKIRTSTETPQSFYRKISCS